MGGQRQLAHLPNSGRLEECLRPGARVLLAQRPSRQRKTGYDLVMAAVGGVLVSVDARLPPALVAEAFSKGVLAPLSRIDLAFRSPNREALVEVKSITLVRQGRALFPDAPTLRGRRHVETLARAVKQGYEAAVIFVVQHPDALAFQPNAEVDPQFVQSLRRAHAQGLDCYAYTCQVSPDEVTLSHRIPVFL